MKAVLIFPPGGDISQPYTSLPYLTAALKKNGHSVIQRDLGLEAFKFFMRAEHFKECYQLAERRFKQLDKRRKLSFRQQKEYRNLCDLLFAREDIIENYKKGMAIIRNKQSFLDPHKLSFAKESIGMAFRLISAEYFPSSWGWSGYYQGFDNRRVSGLIEALSKKEQNLFIRFYEEKLVSDIVEKRPDLVGISISFMSQLIPGLTLARLLKEKDRNIHICIGGTILLYMTEILQHSAGLFSFFDSAILFEGETALLELLERLRAKHDFAKVPNIIFYNGKKIVKSEKIHIEDINSLPTPCFDDFDLNGYLIPEKVAFLSPSRGCYWKKCAFCGMSPTLRLKYRERKPELFLEDIKAINKKYEVEHFSFNGDVVPPAWLQRLSKMIIRDNLSIKWDSEVRLEKEFSYQTCKTLHDAGCRYLRFGFESGNNRVLNLMQKGTDLQTVRKVIDNCFRAQIRIGLEAFVGFPGETREEARDTLNFIIKNSKKIGSVVILEFWLVKYSSVYKTPEKFGVELIDSNSIIQYRFDYKIKTGISASEAAELSDEFMQRIKKLFPWNAICSNACGSANSILYAAHYKTNKFFKYGPRDKGQIASGSDRAKLRSASPLLLHFNINKIDNNINNKNVKEALFAEKKSLLAIRKDEKLHLVRLA